MKLPSGLRPAVRFNTLHLENLGIALRRKPWLLNLDMIVLSDSGGVYDALFLVGRSALWDAKVPKTRSPYQPKSTIAGDRDVKMSANGSDSTFNTRKVTKGPVSKLADHRGEWKSSKSGLYA